MDLNIIVISINVRVAWRLMEDGSVVKAHVQTQQLYLEPPDTETCMSMVDVSE